MKRRIYGLLIIALTSNVALAGGPVSSPSSTISPFIGLNYIYLRQNGTSALNEQVAGQPVSVDPSGNLPNRFSGYEIDLGLKYGDYVGFAVGWDQYGKENRTTSINTTTISITEKPKATYADVRVFWPIYNLDLVGLIGISATWFDGTLVTSFGSLSFLQKTLVNVRIGVGIDYYFNLHWGAQVLFKYTPMDNLYLQEVWTVSGGIYYQFG